MTQNNLLSKEAFAKDKAIKGSVQKLGLVAQLIRGMKAQEALIQLEFSKKGCARSFHKVLKSAIANAENNHSIDIDNLYVSRVLVGKTFTLKRFHARGRGKAAGIKKPFSNLTIFVSEKGN